MEREFNELSDKSKEASANFSKSFSFMWSFKVALGQVVAKLVACVLVLIVLVIPIALVASLSGSTSSSGNITEETIEEGSFDKKIAVININGDIVSDTGGFSVTDNTTPKMIKDELKNALDDESVKGIILKVSSGGGEAVASRLIYDQIKKAGEKKPIYAFIQDIGASGAYMSSLGAGQIYAYPEAWVGSIGVIMQMTNYSELANKYGVKQYTFKTGELKDAGDPMGEMTAKNKDYFNYLLNNSFKSFSSIVKERRGLDDTTIATVTDGSVFITEDALKYKLIDKITDFDGTVSDMKAKIGDDKATVVEYKRSGSFTDLLSVKVGNFIKGFTAAKTTDMQVMYK
jgi:protease-4